MKIKCPTCQTQHEYSQSNPDRPFCSERCKMIDLGEWASEGHRIAGEDAPAQDDEQDIH